MTERAVVLGLGETGLSCVSYLRAQGYEVTVCDTRAAPPLLGSLRTRHPQVPVLLGDFRKEVLTTADLLVVSPGLSLKEPAIAAARDQGVPTVGDIELFARACLAPVIAITGSNGKSTVTTLVGDMLARAGLDVAVGGNIGIPALTLLDRPAPDIYVLELSSFQLETTASLNAQAATVLNISPDHMDRYEDLSDYAHAKVRIFSGVGRMVINRDDPWVVAMGHEDREVVTFGLGRPTGHDFGLIDHAGAPWLARGREPVLAEAAVPVPGRHNVANVLAAFALATAASRDFEAMAQAVREFRGLAHRTQIVAKRDGIDWIDDSKGTNVGATAAAMAGLAGPVVLIAGGDGKGADFTPLAASVRGKARAVVLIGRDAARIEEALRGCCPIVHARDMDEAVLLAREQAHSGDQVLLSPACASFDMFRNYAHRGEVFADAVRRHVAGSAEDTHG
ncbi:UDP-N-acetylmuramoyl-L-alanine--D-glutamate ligase [Acidiferrobacter sp.]|uniref:UDP-N-acetylmuramoyl-L-alanine--D-glutamate ligase n=1 Tax=Acidiferrobacter sp. TaxID=1872107 RepID=UPI0026026798|nr:UDP-N-acetylmuramoyl-L-alanine--D-glutamate ligase [Acidiferrobacter sp.]